MLGPLFDPICQLRINSIIFLNIHQVIPHSNATHPNSLKVKPALVSSSQCRTHVIRVDFRGRSVSQITQVLPIPAVSLSSRARGPLLMNPSIRHLQITKGWPIYHYIEINLVLAYLILITLTNRWSGQSWSTKDRLQHCPDASVHRALSFFLIRFRSRSALWHVDVGNEHSRRSQRQSVVPAGNFHCRFDAESRLGRLFVVAENSFFPASAFELSCRSNSSVVEESEPGH